MIKRFEGTDRFQPAAQHKDKYGFYTDAPFGSKAYKAYWDEQDHRCLNGYTIDGVRVTGPHYFMLNFTKLTIVKDPTAVRSDKIDTWPRFWDLHYDFFHVLEASEKAGKHLTILKPRGTGFSEIMATIGVYNYTMFEKSKNFYFASSEGFLNKDGVLTKCWDKLNFLNQQTDRGYKHLRQVKDQDLHKRASYKNEDDEEVGQMSEIIGRVVDVPRKARGARTGSRGKVFLEEGGSFPNTREIINVIRPLVEQGGVTTGQIIMWGTGGEQGAGIAGLEHVFTHPSGFNMYAFDNVWDKNAEGQKIGWFFPTYACMDRFMDKDGNCDQEAAKAFHDAERAKIRKTSPEDEDRYIAEYPNVPGEALMRLTANEFPVAEAQRQLMRVRSDAGIQGMLKHGWIIRGSKGLQFSIDPNARPLKTYHLEAGVKTDGCITMLESPFKGADGIVPDGMYSILLDPYYKDEAIDSKSLGAAYVYKHVNDLSPSEDDILVAWYVARPKTLSIFYENLFLLARIYRARIQSEIAGGGKGVLDHARVHKMLEWCELEPDILAPGEIPKRKKNYFMDMGVDRVKLAISYFGDWLRKERSYSLIGNDTEFTSIINVNKIYDEALLEEIIRYDDENNFDRISALRLLPFMIKERTNHIIKAREETADDFWNRPLYADADHDNVRKLHPNEAYDPDMQTEFTASFGE
jgi:hypothetical protein